MSELSDIAELLKEINDKMNVILSPSPYEIIPPYVYNSVFGNQSSIEDVKEFDFVKEMRGTSAKYVLMCLSEDAYITIWVNNKEIMLPRIFESNKWYDISEASIERVRIELVTASAADIQLYATTVPPLGASTGVYQMFHSPVGPGVR